ncbi:MAG: hypothetical protein D3926_08775 [Desulfobacteraceae bacterium]|nr:MAG: hypothetical protein D3926_08775 [Desulfobacteraceae bacterium]
MDGIISEFVDAFNRMCRDNRRDFLIRERVVTYESGSRIKQYQVRYMVKQKKNKWEIYAQSKGFWIFKSKFPLIRIEKKHDQVLISGMFTEAIASPFDPSELKAKLDQYLIICQNLPKDAFVRS